MHLQQRLRKKKEGAAESSYPFSSALVSMGTRAALCGLRKSPLPLPNARGPIPRDYTCVANFPSVLLASPTPTGPQQQHPSPQKRKEKKSSVHLSWIESLSTKVAKIPGARVRPKGLRPPWGFWPHVPTLLQAGCDHYFLTLFMHSTHILDPS